MSISIGEISFGATNPNKALAKAGGATMKYAAANTKLYNDAQKIATSQGIDMAKAATNMAVPAMFAGPAGPVAAVGIGVVAGVFSSVFGSHRAPVYRKPAGFDAWSPSPRDWVVVVEALKYCKENKTALDNVSKALQITIPALPDAWSTADAERRMKLEAEIKAGFYTAKYQINQLLGLLTRDGIKLLDARIGAKKLDKLVVGGKYAGRDISVRGPRIEGSPIHWFEMAAYTPAERWRAGETFRNSAVVHACLIQFANALPAQAWMEEAHLIDPEPRIARTKDLPKNDTKEATGLMSYDWKGNLRFILSWVEKRHQFNGKWTSYNLKKKAEIERALIENGGTSVTKVLKGRVYALRPIIVYRAGGANPDLSAGRMVFMEQFGIAQIPGGNAKLEIKAAEVVKALAPVIKPAPGVKPAVVKPSVAPLRIKLLTDIADSQKPPAESKSSSPDEEPPAPVVAAVEAPTGALTTETLTPTVVEKAATDAVESASKATGLTPMLLVGGLAIGAILLLKK